MFTRPSVRPAVYVSPRQLLSHQRYAVISHRHDAARGCDSPARHRVRFSIGLLGSLTIFQWLIVIFPQEPFEVLQQSHA